MADKNGIKALVAFVERGQGRQIARFYTQNQIQLSFHLLGNGTASSELMDVLGLGTSEKDILLGIAAGPVVNQAINKMDNDSSNVDASGIMFDLNLTGLNSIVATALLHKAQEGNGGAVMEETNKENSLILVSVNQGYTDEVMDTARGAGARGGTIVRARWAGEKESEHFYGINVQTEKEIIAIVAPTKNRNAIMETINMKHGLKTDANAMICSLGIEHMIRI